MHPQPANEPLITAAVFEVNFTFWFAHVRLEAAARSSAEDILANARTNTFTKHTRLN